jgi:hypothetical protein
MSLLAWKEPSWALDVLCSSMPISGMQLANASPDLINRLIPEHVRRQNSLNFAHAGS